MKVWWKILLVSAIGIMSIGSAQANGINGQPEEPPASGPQAKQVAQAAASDDNYKWSIKPLDMVKNPVLSANDNYRWLNKPSGENQTETIKLADLIDFPPAKPEAAKKTTTYYRRADSYATNPDSDPPRYVRTLNTIGIEAFKDITWLDIGFEFRTRYEMRRNDIRHVEGGFDNPFFLRSRAYLGIKEILDPFRFAVEFQDSRVYNHKFPSTDQENNPYDLIQGYGELHFKQALGQDDRKQDRPVRFRAGRMAYEALDRRFIGRNEWRNTTNAFDGFRLNLGKQDNDWEIDMWGMQPVKRLQTRFDEANNHLWFYGAIGHWRKWSDIITLQPYYMGQKQTADPNGFTATNRLDREIHMPSLRGYGRIGNLLDYDLNFSYQFGTNGTQVHDAYGYTAEVGRTFNYAWKPRLS
ncbi:MAG: alginate export family protein, partial [Nitrosospira sp.]